MFSAFHVLRLFTKSLTRLAIAVEEIRDLYRLDLATRGIVPTIPNLHDEVEVLYGYQEPPEDE